MKYNHNVFINCPFDKKYQPIEDAQHFGGKSHDGKSCLIFDKELHRYEKFISDIKGHDIIGHGNEPWKVVDPIRDCLAEAANDQEILLGSEICNRYFAFCNWLTKRRVKRESLSFGKFSHIVSRFLASVS